MVIGFMVKGKGGIYQGSVVKVNERQSGKGGKGKHSLAQADVPPTVIWDPSSTHHCHIHLQLFHWMGPDPVPSKQSD